jgi:hypothetical protein
MEGNSVFVYLSIIEGALIVCMLGWEIFWLRKMYQVLWRMPTSEQIEEMVNMIRSDRESIKTSLLSLVTAFEPLKTMFGSLTGGIVGSLFGSGNNNKSTIVDVEKVEK